MSTASEQLQAMRFLGENWDGYGAAAPQADALDLAQAFVGLMEVVLRKAAPAALRVSPTRVGGVLIEWADEALEHEVEINPDRSISFLHHHKSSGHMETRKFSPAPGVVQPGFLHELRQLVAA
jgi:hypothetical protein